MPEPIKFKHLIAEMAGGRDAIMAVAREQNAEALAKGAAPTTKALAVEHILEAIRMQVSKPLTKLFKAHMCAVEDEYELVEGPNPGDDNESAETWWSGIRTALSDALDGETLELIGVDDLADWIIEDEPVEALVTLILEKGIKDPANALAKCGITKEDITSLITPSLMAAPRGTHGSPELDADAAKLEAMGEDPGPTIEALTIDVVDVGSQTMNIPVGRATRKRAPKIDGPTPVTAAAAAALTALIDHSAYKEADVAAALGVSRTQALNYRTGKTLWEPSDAQMGALRELFDAALAKLRLPLGELEGAWLE